MSNLQDSDKHFNIGFSNKGKMLKIDLLLGKTQATALLKAEAIDVLMASLRRVKRNIQVEINKDMINNDRKRNRKS